MDAKSACGDDSASRMLATDEAFQKEYIFNCSESFQARRRCYSGEVKFFRRSAIRMRSFRIMNRSCLPHKEGPNSLLGATVLVENRIATRYHLPGSPRIFKLSSRVGGSVLLLGSSLAEWRVGEPDSARRQRLCRSESAQALPPIATGTDPAPNLPH
jgi:hypothetical protein